MDGKYELNFVKRHQLRERIISLGVSYQQVADFLGIGKSTLQRWINGKITNCSAVLWPRLEALLSGRLDAELCLCAKEEAASKYLQLRKVTSLDGYEALVEQFSQAYHLCCQYNCQQEFLERMEQFCEEVAEELPSMH